MAFAPVRPDTTHYSVARAMPLECYMQIVSDVFSASAVYPNLVLTIGSFDGVHLGHRRILDAVVAHARAMDGTPALMTLRPHPREFFSPGNAPNTLTSDAKQEELLAAAGIEVLYILPFNAATAGLSPEAFVETIVAGRCHARRLIVGHDFCFGKGAAGDYEFLEIVGPRFGFDVVQAPQLVINGERVSSTLIRELILQGELDSIETFLGRKYSIVGEVAHGRGIGVQLGFPTANVAPHHSAVPANGVYAAQVHVEGRVHPAAVNIGVAPTIRGEDNTIEAHLLDFDGDLSGKGVEVVFYKRLRPERKFPSRDALVAQITQDVQEVRAYFAK
jgi:riboflavin kinase / FMN adenylyltransferase